MHKLGISKGLAFGSLSLFALGGLGCSSSTGTSESQPTYYRDIAPLVDAKCGNCHTAGGIAPFSLESYEQVKALAPAVRSSVVSKSMPPWPAANDCAEYLDNRSLTDEQIDRLVQWIDDGMAEGNPADKTVEVPVETMKMSRVDLDLKLPIAYTPKTSPDDYRCFFVDWPETETAYVTGFGVNPDQVPIVHHVITFLARPESLADFEALDAKDAEVGWPCYGGPGGNAARANWVGSWAPGGEGSDYPAGTGIEIPPGSKLIVQMHYNTSTVAPVADQTSILVKVDKNVEKKAITMPFTNISWVQDHTMSIPPHTNDVTHAHSQDPTKFVGFLSQGAISSNVPLTIHRAGAHMHTFGKSINLQINRASGENECLVDIPSWNFHWQGQYGFTEPKILEPGDSLGIQCIYDNPTSNELNWGEGTGDEMCLGIYYLTE
jgi:hypothetical protein